MKYFYHIGFFIFFMLSAAYAATPFSSAEQTALVKAHNKWRSQVKVAPLHWSNELAAMAQDYADELEVNENCRPVHSDTENLGENLYWASPITYSDGRSEVQAISPSHAVAAWGNEKAHYHYASNSCAAAKVCGHYTQIVWANTTEVGCGKALCPDKSQVWVCHYAPAGNYIGQKPY